MAKFVQPVIKYSGTLYAQRGVEYQGSDFTLGNIMQFRDAGVTVSINRTDAFAVEKGETLYVNTGVTYTFSANCTIVFGEMVEIY